MKVEVYDCFGSESLYTLEMPASEIAQFVALIKAHGCEDMEGNEYKFNNAKVCSGGFIVYVENA